MSIEQNSTINKQTKVLCIFDGFGLAPISHNNCISQANMPTFRKLLKDYTWTTLNADGEHVGQEAGLVGNSEVGHMNIGGLKLVPQLSYQITKSADKAFNIDKDLAPDQLFDPKELLTQNFTTKNNKTVHLIGLFSTGSIHSDMRHWVAGIEASGQAGAEKIVLHLISDGRDSDKKSLVASWQYFIDTYQDRLKLFEDKVYLGSLGGRFYGMDRDNNWDRVWTGVDVMFGLNTLRYDYLQFILKKKYNIDLPNTDIASKIDGLPKIVEHSFGVDDHYDRIKDYLQWRVDYEYKNNNFDETISPEAFTSDNVLMSCASIEKDDSVWLINFRSDRMKQFTKILCDLNKEFELNLNILANNDYGIEGVDGNIDYHAIFRSQPVQNTLSDTIAKMGKSQLHIAETEKYNHVTYFLNGGQNKKNQGEDWIVINSDKVESYAQKPNMKAEEVTDYILENGLGKYDYIIVNYANPDMVGHTGNIEAGIESMSFLDGQLARLIEKIKKENHSLVFIADHGNMEFVGEFDKDGKHLTDTEHNANPVPCVVVQKEFSLEKLIQNLDSLSIKYNKDLLYRAFEQNNRLDVTDHSKWLTKDTIPASQLPLWYSSLVLLGL
jgi:2,3-bisphosphoglycerate-independent phosphoglycerate mutase